MKVTLEGESTKNGEPGNHTGDDDIDDGSDAPLVPPDWLKEDIRNFTKEKNFNKDAPAFDASRAGIGLVDKKRNNVSLNMDNYANWRVEKKKQAPRLKTAAQLIEPMLETLSAREGATSYTMERVSAKMREKHDQQIAEHQRYFQASLKSPRRPQTLRASTTTPRGKHLKSDTLNRTGISDLSSSFAANTLSSRAGDDSSALQMVQSSFEQEQAIMMYEARKKLLLLAPISFFYQSLVRNLRLLHIRKKACTGKIQRAYREYRGRKALTQLHNTTVTFPVAFNLAVRIWRKGRALRMIGSFLKDHHRFGAKIMLRRFFICVKKCQQVVHSTLEVMRCRRQLIHLYWDRLEHQIRNKDLNEEAAKAERLRREIAKRAMETGPAGANDIHAKWERRYRKTQSLLLHLDSVQTKYQRVVEQELARSKEKETTASRADGMGATTGGHNHVNNRHGNRKNGHDLDSIAATDFKLRDEVIRRHIVEKRRLHSQIIDDMRRREATNQLSSGIDISHARKLLLEFDESAASIARTQVTISSNDQNSGKSTIKKWSHKLMQRQRRDIRRSSKATIVQGEEASREDSEEDSLQPTPFLCLTDPSLGPSWKEIITQVVNEEIVQEKEAASRAILARNSTALRIPSAGGDGLLRAPSAMLKTTISGNMLMLAAGASGGNMLAAGASGGNMLAAGASGGSAPSIRGSSSHDGGTVSSPRNHRGSTMSSSISHHLSGGNSARG